jgi:hypothetical protein
MLFQEQTQKLLLPYHCPTRRDISTGCQISLPCSALLLKDLRCKDSFVFHGQAPDRSVFLHCLAGRFKIHKQYAEII